MCFSAEASFTSAAILAGIGYKTIKQASSKEDLLWLSIPCFFAFQQFCEGVVWLGLTGKMEWDAIANFAKNLYLFFALGFWPFWIPLAFLLPEKNRLRRLSILLTFGFGIAVAYVNLSVLPPASQTPIMMEHSIKYFSDPIFQYKIAYLVAVTLPMFLSSLKFMWIFGLATIISCFATVIFYTDAFASIWCFSAAILSLVLYVFARNRAKELATLNNLQTKTIPLNQDNIKK